MASHTNGPWTVVDGRQIYGPNRDDELLAEVTDTAEGLEGGDGVADANAVLMGAAPDLLAVLLAYEQWEASLILDDNSWRNGLPMLTQAQYNRLIEIQQMRNAAKRKAVE